MEMLAQIPGHTPLRITVCFGETELQLTTSVRLSSPEGADGVLEFCFDRIRNHVRTIANK